MIFDNSSTQRESELIPYEDPNAPAFRTGVIRLITVANHVFGVRSFETAEIQHSYGVSAEPIGGLGTIGIVAKTVIFPDFSARSSLQDCSESRLLRLEAENPQKKSGNKTLGSDWKACQKLWANSLCSRRTMLLNPDGAKGDSETVSLLYRRKIGFLSFSSLDLFRVV